MPILRRIARSDAPVLLQETSPTALRPSAHFIENNDSYGDGTFGDEVRGKTESRPDAMNEASEFEQDLKELLDRRMATGFALVRLDASRDFMASSRTAGQKEMLRLIRHALTTLRELNSSPGVGMTWRISWILAELADFGVHLRWTSPHVPFI